MDVEWRVAMRPGRRRKLRAGSCEALRSKSSIRAKVEHPFLYVKRHFGYAKVRYLVQEHATGGDGLGLANLVRAERHLAV